ncbi:Mitochondrial inner membrane protein OXA1L [Zancudomyces culisetae]|uniref:Mitochondrial inner membrane protein OXA1L n=1 Tax=Zancudomyces culisetae TaxID=1213189 RepID=A0A1R1PLW6_ZANCU|nr:Mitochondrial inner membrane protein OXA1L [Zancudomyces culisetae]OMH85090.1 Mitochondrial inner membrane protein OXA1L [Zancudomyces culisetae]|eukprot:OMH81954.1 Mitochondrial inner membrane protein OXA1L [Zancudomyces culisetae]
MNTGFSLASTRLLVNRQKLGMFSGIGASRMHMSSTTTTSTATTASIPEAQVAESVAAANINATIGTDALVESNVVSQAAETVSNEGVAAATSAADVLETTSTVLVESTEVVNSATTALVMQIGDLKAVGLCSSYTPVGWVQTFLEATHVYTGMPWWGTILAATVVVRMALYPISGIMQKKVIKMQNIQPEMQKIKTVMDRAKNDGNILEYRTQAYQLQHLLKKEGVGPFSALGLALLQFPVMVSFFLALRGMAYLPVEHLKTGGLWWFTDLTAADPYYILPVLASATMIGSLEITRRYQNSVEQPPAMIWGIRFVGAFTAIATIKFPPAIFIYWIASNILSVLQSYSYSLPFVRRLFKIPELKKAKMAIVPKNKFVKTVESLQKNLKKQ